MGKMVSFEVEPGLLKAIDSCVKASGFYSSRSEFFKDSARVNLLRVKSMSGEVVEFDKGVDELRRKARSRGWSPSKYTAGQREEIVKEFLRENKIKL
jgi:Arc/MetJ-type ribon-helix-helix transcriptional regulator